jgi:hypothetical protein
MYCLKKTIRMVGYYKRGVICSAASVSIQRRKKAQSAIGAVTPQSAAQIAAERKIK